MHGLNIPNQITILRLLFTVVFVAALGIFQHGATSTWVLDLALAVFVLAAATDYLDGYLARRHNQVTKFGRVMDTFADKLLICSAFIMLAGPGLADRHGASLTGVAPWMVVVIVGRELWVLVLKSLSESTGAAFPPSLSGKIKMWLQCLAVGWVLVTTAHPAVGGAGANIIRDALIWLTLLVTILSMVEYVVRQRTLFEFS